MSIVTKATNLQLFEACFLIMLGIISIYIINRIVRVYNMDFEGNYRLVGYTYLKVYQDGYLARLGENIRNHSLTNEYILLTNEFELGFIDGAEVYVDFGNKRVSVPLEGEMKVVF